MIIDFYLIIICLFFVFYSRDKIKKKKKTKRFDVFINSILIEKQKQKSIKYLEKKKEK